MRDLPRPSILLDDQLLAGQEDGRFMQSAPVYRRGASGSGLAALRLADAERLASARHDTASPDALDPDVLELPEPDSPEPDAEATPRQHFNPILWQPVPLPPEFGKILSDRSPAPAATSDHPPTPVNHLDQFDYNAWSAELDDLLKRPLLATQHQRSNSRPQPAHHDDEDRVALTAPLVVTPGDGASFDRQGAHAADRQPAGRRRGAATWLPLVVLCSAGFVMAGIIGGAAFGLAAPEARSWLLDAGRLLDQLQIAVSR